MLQDQHFIGVAGVKFDERQQVCRAGVKGAGDVGQIADQPLQHLPQSGTLQMLS